MVRNDRSEPERAPKGTILDARGEPTASRRNNQNSGSDRSDRNENSGRTQPAVTQPPGLSLSELLNRAVIFSLTTEQQTSLRNQFLELLPRDQQEQAIVAKNLGRMPIVIAIQTIRSIGLNANRQIAQREMNVLKINPGE